MKGLIDDCVFSSSMKLKWQHMVKDARATLTEAFDSMINEPHKISSYDSEIVQFTNRKFEVLWITIGYATFVMCTSFETKIVLLDVDLQDGKPVFKFNNAPRQLREKLQSCILSGRNL